jgi:hypothetical protein
MVATTTIRHRQTNRKNHLKTGKLSAAAINHAVRIIHAICGLAGSANLIENIRADLRADKVQAAIRHRDTAVVFDWLMAALSYQGIADAVAYDYMEQHGRAAWREMPDRSIQRFRKLFPGSCSTRSGGTAARAASMSATATASMMSNAATTWIVEYA